MLNVITRLLPHCSQSCNKEQKGDDTIVGRSLQLNDVKIIQQRDPFQWYFVVMVCSLDKNK